LKHRNRQILFVRDTQNVSLASILIPKTMENNNSNYTTEENTSTDDNVNHEINAPDEEVAKLKQEIGEYKDKYVRLYADFDNYKRRTAKEKIEFHKTATESLILAMLPILDDFERASKTFTAEMKELEPVKQGFDLIHAKMYKALSSQGLVPIKAIGEVFDSELHEAITQIPAPSEDLKGKVVDEVEKGYYLGEKVIRFSKVIIGA
jgi:molecular chaperone GrpE